VLVPRQLLERPDPDDRVGSEGGEEGVHVGRRVVLAAAVVERVVGGQLVGVHAGEAVGRAVQRQRPPAGLDEARGRRRHGGRGGRGDRRGGGRRDGARGGRGDRRRGGRGDRGGRRRRHRRGGRGRRRRTGHRVRCAGRDPAGGRGHRLGAGGGRRGDGEGGAEAALAPSGERAQAHAAED